MSRYLEVAKQMGSFAPDAIKENSENPGIRKKLSKLPNASGFANAVIGLRESREKNKNRQVEAYELQIKKMCELHEITIAHLEKLLGFSLDIE